ncbi:MAG: hypothetical protein JOZ15_16940, partial [Acidobacteria bacterium]|nr:hypothetical protein [Acidobacteriota bacterium]
MTMNGAGARRRGGEAVRARVPLWRGAKTTPVVAAVAGGRSLAVAGNQERSVLVFDVADLLRDQGRAAPQRLRNSGASARDVAFARSGDRWGLVLYDRPRDNPAGPPRPPG